MNTTTTGYTKNMTVPWCDDRNLTAGGIVTSQRPLCEVDLAATIPDYS